jgi:adenylate kinase family enzyme
MLDLVQEAFIAAAAAGVGYVLDGIPRTMQQARATYLLARELGMIANVALHLVVEDRELVRRLLTRAELEGRSDDNEDVIRRRQDVYHEVTHPIVAWYHERGILVSRPRIGRTLRMRCPLGTIVAVRTIDPGGRMGVVHGHPGCLGRPASAGEDKEVM